MPLVASMCMCCMRTVSSLPLSPLPPFSVSATVTIPFDTLNKTKSVIILPATFDPEKEVSLFLPGLCSVRAHVIFPSFPPLLLLPQGPFNIAVTMDCDFELLPAS